MPCLRLESAWIMSDRIYILCGEALYEQARQVGQLTTPSLQSEGFIHASPAHQLNRVANLYYAQSPRLLLLTVQVSTVQAEIRWEPASTGDLYPHIYGPLNLDAVVQVTSVDRGPAGYAFPDESVL